MGVLIIYIEKHATIDTANVCVESRVQDVLNELEGLGELGVGARNLTAIGNVVTSVASLWTTLCTDND